MTFAYFVAGTGTDVGKTHVAAGLLRAAVARGLSVEATKPVMSGVDESALETSDSGVLLDAAGRLAAAAAVAEMSPWRFAAPLAPTAAARLEGRTLKYGEVLSFCRLRLQERVGLHLVESAGGIMSPIAEGALCIDLAGGLALPIVLVAGSYLGGVSHTLTALAALEARGLAVSAVIVNEATEGGLPAADVIAELTPFTSPTRLFAWPHGRDAPSAELLTGLQLGTSGGV